MKVYYSKEDLLKAFYEKYNSNWRKFCRQKEGKWCYRNNTKLFNEFQSKFKGMAFDFRENNFQISFKEKLENFFNDKKIQFVIEEEVLIGNAGNIKNRIDMMISLPEYDLLLPVELKHDESYWKDCEISNQLERYNECLKEYQIETYLVSPKGKYGFCEKEFFFILKTLVDSESLFLNSSLNYIREQKIA
jgi:hypothetical protein